jgi:hypothetical protein
VSRAEAVATSGPGEWKAQYGLVERPDPCLVQLVSKLAREPWTDRPTCVHPTLGSIGRMVHDCSSRENRAALLPWAPAFIGTAHVGFDTSARLVALCVSTALTSPDQRRITADEHRRLAAAHQTALYLLSGREGEQLGGTARWWFPVLDRVGLSEPFYRTFVATEHAAEAVAVTARASGADSDVRLRQLLRQCLATASRTVRAAERRRDDSQGARRSGAPRPSVSTSADAHQLWS